MVGAMCASRLIETQEEGVMKLASRKMIPVNHVTSEVKAPSDESLALLLPDWPLDVPLVRVRTCGTLTVEVLIDLIPDSPNHLEPVYGPPATDILKIPGMTAAFLLLALLASQADGFATKDFLMQTLPYLRRGGVAHKESGSLANEECDLDEDEALRRLDNVVTLLRKLLYPPKLLHIPGEKKLRKRLVRYVPATQESGPGYRLAAFPLLWLDIEVMETYVKEARLREEHGEDGLEEWQAAYKIGMRGSFLGHEPYSDWANWRRLRVDDLLWQSVSAQYQRAQMWENKKQGLEAAQHLLFNFWQGCQANEDAFRWLVEVLRRQERFQQAEECYVQLCAALDREGRPLLRQTQEAMEILRATRVEVEKRQSLPSVPVSDSRVVAGILDSVDAQTLRTASLAQSDAAASLQIIPETRHLIGRGAWLAGIQQMVQRFPGKKLIVLQGSVGIGKSSELVRLAHAFQETPDARYRVSWLLLKAADATGGPEAALDAFLGTLQSVCGIA